MKQGKYEGAFLSLIFIVISYLFSRNHYSLFFICLVILFLLIVFFKEKNRLFAWLIIAFYIGHLMTTYFDLFLEGFQITPFILVIINQFLYILPILMMCYVIMKFSKESSFSSQNHPYLSKMHILLGESVPIKRIYFYVLILLVLSAMAFFLTTSIQMNGKVFLSLVLFATIHCIIEEMVWRDLWLTHIRKMTNVNSSIAVTSISFGLNTTMFGYSPYILVFFILLGVLLGYLKVKLNSIFPGIVVHVFIIIILYSTGFLSIPI